MLIIEIKQIMYSLLGYMEPTILLVDKVIGAVQTTVSVTMCKSVLCRVEVTVENFLHGLLYPRILCAHLNHTVER